MAYAPIKFFSQNTPALAGFGWIGMGVDVEKFSEVAVKATQNIDKEAKVWSTEKVLSTTTRKKTNNL
ncbi:MAG: hypothetical protein WC405_04775 [Syntrophales bacterium]